MYQPPVLSHFLIKSNFYANCNKHFFVLWSSSPMIQLQSVKIFYKLLRYQNCLFQTKWNSIKVMSDTTAYNLNESNLIFQKQHSVICIVILTFSFEMLPYCPISHFCLIRLGSLTHQMIINGFYFSIFDSKGTRKLVASLVPLLSLSKLFED